MVVPVGGSCQNLAFSVKCFLFSDPVPFVITDCQHLAERPGKGVVGKCTSLMHWLSLSTRLYQLLWWQAGLINIQGKLLTSILAEERYPILFVVDWMTSLFPPLNHICVHAKSVWFHHCLFYGLNYKLGSLQYPWHLQLPLSSLQLCWLCHISHVNIIVHLHTTQYLNARTDSNSILALLQCSSESNMSDFTMNTGFWWEYFSYYHIITWHGLSH